MVRFGVLGAGNIAHRFCASLAHEDGAELVAVSCRTEQKARAFLAEVGHVEGARAYGSHEDLLADAEVDAIYLALPHDLHRDWSLAALRAGKAVLCEKPAMLSAEEMCEVADAARDAGVLFMEAMKPRFVPLYKQVLEAVKQIGPLVRVETTLCNDMLAAVEGSGSYHMTPGPGAGVLLDCGIYCASWLQAFGEGTPRLKSIASAERDGIDVYADALLDFGGMPGRLECAFDRAKKRTATLVGTDGRIVVDELHRPQRAVVELAGQEPVVLNVPYEVDDFYGEIHHFVELVETGATESTLMPLDASIGCAEILDVIRAGFQVVPAAPEVLREQERVLR